MDIRFQTAAGGSWKAACTISFAFEGASTAFYTHIPELLKQAPWIEISPAVQDFSAEKSSFTLLYGHPDLALPRLMLVGLGTVADFVTNPRETLRMAMATAVAACAARKIDTLAVTEEILAALAKESGVALELLAEEAVLGALLSLYRYEAFSSEKKAFSPSWLAFLCTQDSIPDAVHQGSRKAQALAKGICLTRDLVNAPANAATPVYLEEQAQALAELYGFQCTSLDVQGLQDAGMSTLWAVAKGSALEPRFLILEHSPAGTEQDAPLILVGKGITFDSGGICLKPAANMHHMKSDMAGAAAVLGFFATLGERSIPQRIIGLIPCAENMPSGAATRPGDVVRTHSGKTVEIINTDAEGRLILCDALSYAQEKWTPRLLVDAATLTGACVVALGVDVAGTFSSDAALAQEICALGVSLGEPMWPMPVWDSFAVPLKSDVADLANMGTREGAAAIAAAFLKQFVKDSTPWVHFDIAGPAFGSKATSLCPAGGRGYLVRTLYALAAGDKTR